MLRMKNRLPQKSTRRPASFIIGLALACTTTLAAAQVGVTERRIGDLEFTLVYPTTATSSPTTFGPVTLDVAVDAPPSPGRRRLVVLSHGTGGSALTDHTLARALVQEGFVVAQPLHRGDNFRDTRDAGLKAFERRPREVTTLLDVLSADPQWGAHLALDRVGVHGMSAGGVTGLSLAGAVWRALNLIQHCLEHGEDDVGFCLQGATTPDQRAARLASFGSVRGVPEAYLPPTLTAWHGGQTPSAGVASDPRPDPRIAAVTLAVPVAAIFSADSLAGIRIPVGLVSAGRDQVLLPRFHSQHVLAHCKTCTWLMDLPGAGHFDVLSPWPEPIARAVAAAQVRGGLPEPGFDAAQRDEANRRVARFMREHLR